MNAESLLQFGRDVEQGEIQNAITQAPTQTRGEATIDAREGETSRTGVLSYQLPAVVVVVGPPG